MRHRFFVKNFAVIALLVILFIGYGSLYPFDFHRASLIDAAGTLIGGWAKRPGRGDFLSNILLYMPLGCFGMLAIRREASALARIGMVLVLGLCLSICVELTQYFDAGRDTEATDVYSNVIGTALGIGVAQFPGRAFWTRLPRPRQADPAAFMLLAAWAGYNLYPFVPVIDLHKYWDALKPLVLYPALSGYGLFTHAAIWIAAAALIDEAVTEKRRAWFAVFAAVLLGSKIVLDGDTLSAAELAGAAVALAWRMALEPWPRLRTLSAVALLTSAVVALRLEPFHFEAAAMPFGWIPFASFMHGSVGVDMQAFLEKFFLYGGLIWLLQKAGLPLFPAIIAVAAMLFATSIAEIYLPGRSAEITDAATAVFVGGLIALVRPARSVVWARPGRLI
ncbi:MAG TPA: VanZ family protein [Rhizomicrobium sp.]|jgi:VanZ family protein|nr:VanZ family protein [Rhizomicrobium sp.]